MKNRHQIYNIFYIVMFALFILLVSWGLIHYNGPSLSEACFGDLTDFSDGWTLADGRKINLSKLNQEDGVLAYEEVSIFHTIPEQLSEGDSVCFRCKNIFFRVFIDGTPVYSPYVSTNAVYTNSSGTDWHYVTLPADSVGKQLEIRYYRVYDSSRACIDHLFFGSPAAAILHTWQDKLVSFVTCILLLFVGLLLMLADIPISMGFRKSHELGYLGLFAISISIWCLAETNLLQFFIGDSRSIHVISCCSLMLIPIPAMLYLDAAFGLRFKWLLPVISSLSALEFAVCWLLHFSKIADIHETLFLSHIMLAVSAAIFFLTIFCNTFLKNRTSSKNIYQFLRGLGFCSMGLAAIVDLIRFYIGSGGDNALFVRLGLLLFIICFGSSSLEKTIKAVKLGAQSELISQLAYKDGLTQIGNRTAFEERLAALEEIKDSLDAVGIVMFDVNDLKFVNDNLGHHTGDEMIINSSEAIQASFSDLPGDCYRIGGDEFAVILSGSNVEARYEAGIKHFVEALNKYNAYPDKKYRLSIAYGFAIYKKGADGRTLTDIYEQADTSMYEKKQEIKAKQGPPELITT